MGLTGTVFGFCEMRTHSSTWTLGFCLAIRILVALLNPQLLPSPVSYKRHQSEKTLLYKLIQENLSSFYQQMDRDYEKGLPDFIKKEFDEFLKCGVLAHGFLRLQCESCKHEKLVAFSCKKH